VQIGSWVLREACRTLRRWQAEGLVDGSMRMSVNTSVRQLIEASFVEIVDRALADNDVAADSLVLEITESVMLADETAAIGALRALRARGVHIAVDDFGTGYSSLGYLKRLPVDGLKIDRSFIDGLGVEREKTAIVKAALAFARALDLSVTAEGIETDLQLEHLASLGCALGQGYRFAPALEPESLAELLRLGTRFPVPTVGAVAIAHEAGEPAA
jgi:EAL domain-containing protein (putative c-di-GMP-specific phosphodiesterase class I)